MSLSDTGREKVFPTSECSTELIQVMRSVGQLEMLRLYIKGLSYSEIAKRMGCSTAGVRWNFQEMISKTGYSCKEDLIAAALESKLLVTTLK
ncbi:MAG: helix-turn-helix transcriptional regulator [Mediterraneibacter faecis]